jgi:hypothetical protein
VGFEGYVGVLCRSEKEGKGGMVEKRRERALNKRREGIYTKLHYFIQCIFNFNLSQQSIAGSRWLTYPMGEQLRHAAQKHGYMSLVHHIPSSEDVHHA